MSPILHGFGSHVCCTVLRPPFPGKSGATPGVLGVSLGVSRASPGESGATPGVSGATPCVSGATPGVSGATPAAPGATPGVYGASGYCRSYLPPGWVGWKGRGRLGRQLSPRKGGQGKGL